MRKAESYLGKMYEAYHCKHNDAQNNTKDAGKIELEVLRIINEPTCCCFLIRRVVKQYYLLSGGILIYLF